MASVGGGATRTTPVELRAPRRQGADGLHVPPKASSPPRPTRRRAVPKNSDQVRSSELVADTHVIRFVVLSSPGLGQIVVFEDHPDVGLPAGGDRGAERRLVPRLPVVGGVEIGDVD